MGIGRRTLGAVILILILTLMLSGCLDESAAKFKLETNVEGQGSVVPSVGKTEYSTDTATSISLEATPADNWEFSHWIGDVLDKKSAKTEIMVDADKQVTAVFIATLGKPIEVSRGELITFSHGIALDFSNVELPANVEVTVSDVEEEIKFPTELDIAGAVVSIKFNDPNVNFEEGVSLKLPVKQGADVERTGIFYKEYDELWIYQPTIVEDGFAITTATHFSTYAVLNAEITQAPQSHTKIRLHEGEEIPLISDSAGAKIKYSTTSPLEGYQLYGSPLHMAGAYFEFYAYAEAPNMIPSEVRTLKYIDSESVVVTVIDESGNTMSDIMVQFVGSNSVPTDEQGEAIQKFSLDETIIYPFLAEYSFEPSAVIAEKGADLTFIANPKAVDINRWELTFNLVEFNDQEQFNPFTSSVIREAMNKLIDRAHLAQEMPSDVYPSVTFISRYSPEYEFMEEYIMALEERYSYDKISAEATIVAEMQTLGAELKDGTWHYGDKKVELIFIIRTEDSDTKFIGNYIAKLLEDLGFVVDRQYMESAEASSIWFLGDPAEGLWHLYTGRWRSQGGHALEGYLLRQFYTPSMSQLLWQAYTPKPELLDAAIQLYNGTFESLAERREVFENGLKLALEYSPRIWLVQGTRFD